MQTLANNEEAVRAARDVLHYLAYGSNLHPFRLTRRVPNARLVATTRLDGHAVSFAKRSKDGSSKCSLATAAGADCAAYVAIYELPLVEKRLLDAAEGLGEGYEQADFRATVENEAYDVFTYVAAASHVTRELLPYDWYKSMVVEGARYHAFPDEYVRRFELQPCMPDPDLGRRNKAVAIVGQMRRIKKGAPGGAPLQNV
ncbi:MAG: gamma-glutamylcyclotransferase [Gammaproteobacteria bacterium]|nr:gamma-glutamylcyclotransferase [Gammaproteobacteria bacterium]NNL44294.1 hypothetical protein [Woeseiaceae bacterium]